MNNQQLNEIKEIIVTQATRVEKMLENTIEGLLERNSKVLTQVIKKEEKKINKHEVKIDKLCTTTLALFQPGAKDLRTVIVISKINAELERMADHCVNISKDSLDLILQPELKPLADLTIMTQEVLKMFRDSITALIDESTDLAIKVCMADEQVDDIHDKIKADLMNVMIKDTNAVERGLFLMHIADNFERIADHITNISEDIIYVTTGKNVKHKQLKESFAVRVEEENK